MTIKHNLAAVNRPSTAAASVGHSSGETAAGRVEVNLPPFKPGDIVDLSRWDKYERPDKRMGRSVVISAYHGGSSGWMIWVKSLDHPELAERDLDSQWMTLLPS